MKINEWQLLGLVCGVFAAVIALDVFLKYNGDTEFRESFTQLPTAIFAKRRAPQMKKQEHTYSPPTTDEDNSTEEG